MSYVGKMKDLIELYLAELECDGVDNVLGVGLPVAGGILTDFAQWLEDDVQDEETPEGNDEVWQDHMNWLREMGVMEDEAPNITGLGLHVQDEATGFEPGKLAVIQAPPILPIGKSNFAHWADYMQAIENTQSLFDQVVEDSLTEEIANPQPGFWKCIKEVISLDGTLIYFTKDKFYEGRPSNLNSGEAALVFIDNTGSKHRTAGSYLYEHFEFAAEFNPD